MNVVPTTSRNVLMFDSNSSKKYFFVLVMGNILVHPECKVSFGSNDATLDSEEGCWRLEVGHSLEATLLRTSRNC